MYFSSFRKVYTLKFCIQYKSNHLQHRHNLYDLHFSSIFPITCCLMFPPLPMAANSIVRKQ